MLLQFEVLSIILFFKLRNNVKIVGLQEPRLQTYVDLVVQNLSFRLWVLTLTYDEKYGTCTTGGGIHWWSYTCTWARHSLVSLLQP
jgi:hypothetical protein